MYFKSNSVEISKDSDIIYIVGHVMRAVNYFRHVEIRFRERKTHKKLRSLVISGLEIRFFSHLPIGQVVENFTCPTKILPAQFTFH